MGFYKVLGVGLLILFSLVVAYLLVRTAAAVGRRGNCIPEG